MDWWAANLEALGGRDPGLARRLRELRGAAPSPARAASASPPLGGPRARLHALLGFAPERLAEARARAHVRTILVVEPEPATLVGWLETADLRPTILDPRVDLVVTDHLEAMRLRLDALWCQARYLFFARSLAVTRAREGAAIDAAAREVLRAVEEGFSKAGCDPEDARVGLEGVARNLERIAALPDARRLAGIYAGRPGFVVSSGPSLARSLPELAAASLDRGFPVFCPDTSVPLLRQVGLDPHVIACKERVERTLEHFKAAGPTRAGLVACPVVHPAIFATHPGPQAFVFRSADFAAWLGVDEPPFEFGGSAGNLAFKLAELAGCDPIVLVGQDLCFAANGDTHAPGTALGAHQPNHHRMEAIELPAKGGGVVRSTPKWRTFLRQFEIDAARSPARVMNATHHGVTIRGTIEVALGELLATLEPGPDPRPAMEAALAPRPAAERSARRLELAARVRDTRRAVGRIAEKIDAGAERARTSAAPAGAGCQDPPPWIEESFSELVFRDLERARDAVLSVDPRTFDRFLMPVVQPVFLSLEMERYEVEHGAASAEDFAARTLQVYRRWFASMRRWTEASVEALDTAPSLAPRGRKRKAKKKRGARSRA